MNETDQQPRGDMEPISSLRMSQSLRGIKPGTFFWFLLFWSILASQASPSHHAVAFVLWHYGGPLQKTLR